MILNRYIYLVSRNFSCNVVKTASFLPKFWHDFSKEEKNKILDAVNNGNVDDLAK